VAGKPEPPLHAESVERVGAVRPLVVGDRLDTDIEGAVRGGADSLLVLTGVTTPADLLLAPPQRRPAYIAADLSGLNVAQPEVTGHDRAFRCGGWTAAAAGANAGGDPWLTVAGGGDWVDGLRALCAAAWTAGLPPGDAAAQLKAAQAAIAAIKPAKH
jgi:hypothetical protein